MELTKNAIMQNAYTNYIRSDYHSLYQCYGSYSAKKESALNYCYELYNKYNGSDFKIISFNTFQFSVGFEGVYNGRKAFFYITRSYDRVIYLEDIYK